MTSTATLLPDSSLIESQLLSLQDITIYPTALPWSRRNNSIKTPSLELLFKGRLDLSTSGVSRSQLLLDRFALLFGLILSGIGGSSLLLSFPAQLLTVVSFVPLSEGSRIDLNHRGLSEGVGSDKFVVRR